MALNSTGVAGALRCAELCQSNNSCAAFTWHDKTCGKYSLDCYFILKPLQCPPWTKVRHDSGHYSGICTHAKPAATQRPSYDAFEKPWPRDVPRGYLDPSQAPARDRGWRAGVEPLSPTSSGSSTLYVDSVRGDDGANGSATAPLRSIAEAVARLPELPPPRTVMLQGTQPHWLNDTIRLGASHSHTTIQPSTMTGDEAIVSGGVSIDGLKWSKHGGITAKGAQIYAAAVPVTLPQFLELFLPPLPNGSQARLVPAREPDGNPERDQSNYKAGAAWSKLGPYGNESSGSHLS